MAALSFYRQVFIHKTLEKLIAKQSEEVSVNNFCVCQTFPLLYVLGTLKNVIVSQVPHK